MEIMELQCSVLFFFIKYEIQDAMIQNSGYINSYINQKILSKQTDKRQTTFSM